MQAHDKYMACGVPETDKANGSQMGRIERTREIARRRNRRAKLKKLRKQFAAAKSETDKTEIQAKAHRVSPFADLAKSS